MWTDNLHHLSARVRAWLASTPRRTFVIYPLAFFLFEFARRGSFFLDLVGIPIMFWGYLQYRWSGAYRSRMGGGGPGIKKHPERLVETGIYAWLRNPMYLGHLIFMAGLAISLHSVAASMLLAFHMYWFNQRAADDEVQLQKLFGPAFVSYSNRVRRWGMI